MLILLFCCVVGVDVLSDDDDDDDDDVCMYVCVCVFFPVLVGFAGVHYLFMCFHVCS